MAEEAGCGTPWGEEETAVAPGNPSLKPQPFPSGFGSHLPHGGPSQRLSRVAGNDEPGKRSQQSTDRRGSTFRVTEPRGGGCTALLPTPDDTVGDLLVEMEGDLDVWKGFEKRLSTLKDERQPGTTQGQPSVQQQQQQVEQKETHSDKPLGAAPVAVQARSTTRFSSGSQRRPVPEKAIRIIQDQLKSTQESIEKVKAIFRRAEDGAPNLNNKLHSMENSHNGTVLLLSHRSQYWPFLTQPGGFEEPLPLIKNLPQDSERGFDSGGPSVPALGKPVPFVDKRRPSIPTKRRKHDDLAPMASTSDADCCRSAKRARYDMEPRNTQSHEDTPCAKKPTLWERMTKSHALASSSQTSANHVVGGGRLSRSRKLLRPFSLTGFFRGVAAQVLDRLRGRCDKSPTHCVACSHTKDAEGANEMAVSEISSGTTESAVVAVLTESRSSDLLISEEGAISDETAVPLSEALADDDLSAVRLQATNSAAEIHTVMGVRDPLYNGDAPVKFMEVRDESVHQEEETGDMEAEVLSSAESTHSSVDAVLEVEFPREELTVESDSVDPVALTTEEEVESVQEEDVVQLTSNVLLETPQAVLASSSTSSTVPSARLLVVIDDEDAAAAETAAAANA